MCQSKRSKRGTHMMQIHFRSNPSSLFRSSFFLHQQRHQCTVISNQNDIAAQSVQRTASRDRTLGHRLTTPRSTETFSKRCDCRRKEDTLPSLRLSAPTNFSTTPCPDLRPHLQAIPLFTEQLPSPATPCRFFTEERRHFWIKAPGASFRSQQLQMPNERLR